MILRPAHERPGAVAFGAILAVSFAGCHVYDPALLDQSVQGDSVSALDPADASVDADVPDAAVADRMIAIADAQAPGIMRGASGGVCGDGVVDRDESCDIAIARGLAGACPDGCSGGQGCVRNVLEGQDCKARCVARELTVIEQDDGCCPPDADWTRDNDCAPKCGNGVVERGERCDPPASCMTKSACASTDACAVAHYQGEPNACTAQCEITRVDACISGDRCCPTGCNASTDTDCTMPRPVFVCNEQHKGSACRSCDCQRCATQSQACLGDMNAMNATLCAAVATCAEVSHCAGSACYCGAGNEDNCNSSPLGRCVDEFHAAARTTSPITILLETNSTAFTIGRAVALLNCRAANCATECGLTSPPVQ